VNRVALDQLCVNTIRFLSVDMVQKANPGHPGPRGARRKQRCSCSSGAQRGSGTLWSPALPLVSFSPCRSHYPSGSPRVLVSVASPSRGGLPLSASTTILSGACSGFTRVTARGFAREPFASSSRGFDAADRSAASLGSYGVEPTTSQAELSSAGHQRLRGAVQRFPRRLLQSTGKDCHGESMHVLATSIAQTR
jgi:hypothetical protein